MSTEANQEQVIEQPVTEEVVQQEGPEAVADEQQSVESQTEQAPVNDDDAAFEAGFAGVDPEPKPTAEEIAKELEFAGYTETQIKELLGKVAEVDKLKEQQAKAFGSLGSLKQAIDNLKSQPRPQATAIQLTKEKFAKLSKEFPELAEMLAEDLNGVLTGGASAPDPAQFEQIIETQLNTRLQPMQQQFEARVLTVMHPDWKQVVPSPEFAQWKQTLPPEVAQELDTSWNAEFIGSKLSEFKDWKTKTAEAQRNKQRKLEAAITPKGGAAKVALSENDAFIQGFKEARGIK